MSVTRSTGRSSAGYLATSGRICPPVARQALDPGSVDLTVEKPLIRPRRSIRVKKRRSDQELCNLRAIYTYNRWFKVAQAEGFEIPANLVIERYPFDDIAEYIRDKRAEFGAIVIDAGGGSAKLFHEAVTEANRLIVPVAPTKIERRKLVATFDEAERAAARNTRDITAHVVMVKADDRTSLPRTAKDRLLQPVKGEGIGPDRDEPFPLADTVIHAWVHYMEAFGEIPTDLSEYTALMKELNA
ncbi:ParA family protein [Streptomyces tauricus]|uniref:ParA family protein n=1 Tax=Streptomyces tauricus TaxID=68274 RepID=UPI00387F239D